MTTRPKKRRFEVTMKVFIWRLRWEIIIQKCFSNRSWRQKRNTSTGSKPNLIRSNRWVLRTIWRSRFTEGVLTTFTHLWNCHWGFTYKNYPVEDKNGLSPVHKFSTKFKCKVEYKEHRKKDGTERTFFCVSPFFPRGYRILNN